MGHSNPSDLRLGYATDITPTVRPLPYYARDIPRSDSRDEITAALERIDGKLTQLIRLQRSLLTLLGDTLRNY